MNKEEWFGDAPHYIITTPATSANLGPGFDCLGMAVDLQNELWVKVLAPTDISRITIEGYGANDDRGLNNLIYTSFVGAFEKIGQEAPKVAFHCINRVPFARGLGSSSAAIVSGLVAAQLLSDFKLSREDLMQMATSIDGHPDNVLPALLGGIVVGCLDKEQHVHAEKIEPVPMLHAYALIPDYPLPTSKARAAMPEVYKREDVVYNLGHLGLLVAALHTGNRALLSEAFSDCIHEPYRLPLMPGIQDAKEKALKKGALAAIVSGAGSTMLILSDGIKDFSDVVTTLAEQKIGSHLLEVPPTSQGVRCFNNEMELRVWL